MARAEERLGRALTRHAKMEQMFADPNVDVVLLVLPIPMMAAAVAAALRAGKHVISEKPAAASLELALDVLRLRRDELPAPAPAWAVCEGWAHKPSVRWLRARVEEGAIGTVLSAELVHHEALGRGASDGWRADGGHLAEGGWLLDGGVHWARLLRYLLGAPLRASATTSSVALRLGLRGDSMHGWATFEHCAAAVSVALSYGMPPRGAGSPAPPSLTLHGERGSLEWWPRDPGAGDGGGGAAAGHARVLLRREGEAAQSVAIADDWVTGGVGEALRDALALVADEAGRRPPSGGAKPLPAVPAICAAEEAVKDLALVTTLLRSTAADADGGRRAAAVLDGALAQPPRPLADASQTRTAHPAALVRCASEREVHAALRLGHARARPVGARHSWSGAAAADANAVVVDTSGMDRVLSIDTERLVVKVEPGVTLRQLRDVLTRRGLTLPSWPMLLDQTVAGAAATGSHGSSARDGSVSDVVVAMRLVTGQGDDGVVVAGAEGAEGGGVEAPGGAMLGLALDTSTQLLQAARLSLGRLGVATSLDLRCERTYYVRRHLHILAASELGGRCDALRRAYRHLWALWALGSDDLALCGLEDVGDAPAADASPYDGENWWKGDVRFKAPRGGIDAPPPPDEEEEGEARWYSMEYALPLAGLPRALEKLAALGAADGSLRGRVLELKFMGSSGGATLLGSNARDDVVCVNLNWRLTAAEVPLLGVIEAELQSLDGMPHLGKAHKLPAGYIGEVFPALGEFCAVARRVDPKWAFSSDWFGNLGGSDD